MTTRDDWKDSVFGGHITWHLTLYYFGIYVKINAYYSVHKLQAAIACTYLRWTWWWPLPLGGGGGGGEGWSYIIMCLWGSFSTPHPHTLPPPPLPLNETLMCTIFSFHTDRLYWNLSIYIYIYVHSLPTICYIVNDCMEVLSKVLLYQHLIHPFRCRSWRLWVSVSWIWQRPL